MRSRFHPDARAEYVHAIVYIDEQRPGYGEKFEAEVFAAVERAIQFPGSGARVEGYPADVDLRSFPLRVFRYSLMIGVEGDEAIIYAVAHQHRKPGYWRERLKSLPSVPPVVGPCPEPHLASGGASASSSSLTGWVAA